MKTDLQSRIEANKEIIASGTIDIYALLGAVIQNHIAILETLMDKRYPCHCCKRWYGENEILNHRCIG